MVDKKVAVAAVLVTGGIAALVLRGDGEAAPAGEGVPMGDVTIEISPLGRRGIFDRVKGAWGVGATVNVNAICTAGFPVPTMVIELWDNDVLRKTLTVTGMTLNTIYTLTDTMTVADVGSHSIQGKMILTNPLGTYMFGSEMQSFDIGEAPPGEVTLDVTLTPP